MTDNIKKTLRLIKYGYQVKGNLALGAVFLALGVFMKLVGTVSMGFDSIFLFMPAIFFCQILYGLDYVKMVSSCHLKKYITVHAANIVVDAVILMVLLLYYALTELRENYFLEIIVPGFEQDGFPGTGWQMLYAGIMAFVIMCYLAGCYKFYWISTLVFILVMMVYGGVSTLIMEFQQEKNLSGPEGALAAAVIYLAGVFVSGIIRRLLYRVPVSSKAIGKKLGMEGKA